MNIIDKVSAGITASVDLIVDKNRELAQLNRLEAIIKNETDVLNHAYIALGKQYFLMLEGDAEEADMSQVCEAVRVSEKRLKKAQTRYDYIKAYGIPDTAVASDSMNYNNNAEASEEAAAECEPDEKPAEAEAAEDESGDITIASVEEKAAEAVKEIKKKRSEKKAGDADAEAAADEG